MAINRKKLQRNLAVIESTFLFYIIFCVNFAMQILVKGGRFALILIPVFEAVHAERYWKQSKHLKDPPIKIFLNKLYYGGKVLVNGLGAALAIVGGLLNHLALLQGGFGLMIAMGFIGVGRNVLKIHLNHDNPNKVNNNAIKVAIGVLISTGFIFMTFFPVVQFIPGLTLTLGNLGGMLAAGAASFIFIVSAPPAIMGTPVKPKNQEEYEDNKHAIFSHNYDVEHVHPPLTFSNIFHVKEKLDDKDSDAGSEIIVQGIRDDDSSSNASSYGYGGR